MSRAGRKRLHASDRQITIIHAIARLKYDYHKPPTLHRIAGLLNMTPSTHLRKMLDALTFGGKISREYIVNGRGQTVAHYDVQPASEQQCDIPWKCDNLCVIHGSGKICLGSAYNRSKGV